MSLNIISYRLEVMEDLSLTFTLTGKSSILEAHIFPPIDLSEHKSYVLGLVELLTFNSIPNIDSGNNQFKVGKEEITLPTGSYELEDIKKYLEAALKQKDISITLEANNNTLNSEISCSETIDFTSENSIAPLLGFNKRILEKGTVHISNQPVKILKINTLRVECNLTTGAFINEERVHTIHEFFPAVPPGFKIIKIPKKIIYLPVFVSSISYIRLLLVDQSSNLVNFRGEEVTIRLHLKSLK